ncbi:MAG TPA: phospho-N-acetylmuramoyl-pentapeptide-transferase [Actinomycetota bacterium]|nr:phospho-N-acetylmuramoyl-pentapeptide-transferase [Actinomycetota bacterium]
MIGILIASAVSLVCSLIGTPLAIRAFRRQGLGQLIQIDLPDSHQTKRGTPTMGGTVIIVGAVVAYVVVHLVSGERAPTTPGGMLVVITMVATGLVGFVDDFLKIRNQRSLGLTVTAKFAGQGLCALLLGLGAWYWADAFRGVSFIRPIYGTQLPLIVFLIWVFLLLSATTNSVNLTDGMDGLASGTTVLVATAYVVIAFWQFRHLCSAPPVDSPGCYRFPPNASPQDLALVAAATMGAVAGFLWWNAPPARIFMGDTGSLSLGGTLAALALFTNTQLLLAVLGGLYVVEALSVILQVASFRFLHRRVFRMAPIHLHFELSEWPEFTVIVRFWILAGLAVAFGLGLFYAEFLAQGGGSG